MGKMGMYIILFGIGIHYDMDIFVSHNQFRAINDSTGCLTKILKIR